MSAVQARGLGLFRPRRFEKIKDKVFGEGSDAVGFRDESGNEYVAKNNELQPYVIANEMVCNSIARRIGIHSPAVEVVKAFDDTWFLSKWVTGSTALAQLYPCDLRTHNVDLAEFALILCFDFWVGNPDRHWGNLLLKPDGNSTQLYAIDHDRALVGFEWDCAGYDAVCGQKCANVLHWQFRKLAAENIVRRSDFDDPLNRIHGISSKQVTWDFCAVDNQLLPGPLAGEMADKLISRRPLLRTYVECLFDSHFVGT